MGQSVAALVYGFLNHDPELSIAGLILNRVGSDRHEAMLHEALSSSPMPILGAIRRNASLSRPSRHLGLIQAAKLTYFSPLADQPPSPEADAIYLPGGYPELHAAALTRAGTFRKAMKDAAVASKVIYGECGGYMVLGHSITDARDIAHPMLGLLDLETSFSKRKLHLGYRDLTATTGPFRGKYKAHEFHYATTLHQSGTPLFQATNATGCIDTQMGLVSGSVSGSFAHIIDRA